MKPHFITQERETIMNAETTETTNHTPETRTGSKASRGLRAVTTLGLAATVSMLSMNGALAIDTTPEAIPGSDGLLRVIKWIIWGGGVVLLMFFIFGLVQAGRSKNGHGEDRVQAPLWPAVMGGLLTGAGTIWTILTGI